MSFVTQEARLVDLRQMASVMRRRSVVYLHNTSLSLQMTQDGHQTPQAVGRWGTRDVGERE